MDNDEIRLEEYATDRACRSGATAVVRRMIFIAREERRKIARYYV